MLTYLLPLIPVSWITHTKNLTILEPGYRDSRCCNSRIYTNSSVATPADRGVQWSVVPGALALPPLWARVWWLGVGCSGSSLLAALLRKIRCCEKFNISKGKTAAALGNPSFRYRPMRALYCIRVELCTATAAGVAPRGFGLGHAV